MIATMVVEVGLAIYTLWRYTMSAITRLTLITLLCLAIFQLAEYYVCTGIGSMALQWSQIGFVAITALPPLGIHILHVLAGKPDRRLVYAAYGTMAVFMIGFTFSSGIFTGHQCTGNYVIFQLGQEVGGAYAVYYFGWLLAGIGLGMRWANQLQAKGRRAESQLWTVRALIIGYLVFLVPTALANVISPSTRSGIPSIMCGFAVIFALILSFYVMPRAAEQKTQALTK
jgi:hypothetical protein